MERQVPHFREELDALQSRLLEMGGLAEERVRMAVDGIVTRDVALIDRVMRGDEPINELHMEIDSRCFTLLALHQPMATDLRAIVAGVKINVDLERVGDLAVNIAEAARNTRLSKTSDNGSGCSADGNLVVEATIYDAFLAQPNDVMATAQELRRKAQSAGNLKSNEYQTVSTSSEQVPGTGQSTTWAACEAR